MLIASYLGDDPEKDRLMSVVRDTSRPGLPVKGVLEHMRKYRKKEYSEEDKETIDDLIYFFG